MNPKNDRFRAFLNVPAWWKEGYTGKRCVVGLGEDFNNTDDYSSHARKVAYVFREIAPDAELVYLPEEGRGDSTFMSEQIQTIKDRHICAWGTSLVTANNGNDVNGAFEQVKDFCTFFTSIGNDIWGQRTYSRLSEADNVYAVAAMHLNPDGTFYPEEYSIAAPSVDFSAPTDWYTMDGAFDGTSGAQPVILAAFGALVNDFFIDKTGNPLSSAMMYQFLKDNSHDFYTVGKDNKTGWGYVTLPDPNTIDIGRYAPLEIKMKIGSNVMTVDGVTKTLDQPPIIAPTGRTLAPVRAVFEAAGLTVAWDPTTQTITATR